MMLYTAIVLLFRSVTYKENNQTELVCFDIIALIAP